MSAFDSFGRCSGAPRFRCRRERRSEGCHISPLQEIGAPAVWRPEYLVQFTLTGRCHKMIVSLAWWRRRAAETGYRWAAEESRATYRSMRHER
jgi:hypothetical protein